MPDIIKPGPPGDGGEDERREDEQEVAMDLMGSSRDFPLQVCLANPFRSMAVCLLLCRLPAKDQSSGCC